MNGELMAMLHGPSERTALAYQGQEISYSELHGHIGRFAGAIAEGKPEKVAVFAENRPEWVYALYATWHVGAILIPIDVMSSEEEIAFILSDCAPSVVFCSLETRPLLERASARQQNPPALVAFEEIAPENVEENIAEKVAEDLPEKTAAKPDSFVFAQPEMSCTAVIIYTSGTTGDPKGVMLTFGNLESNRRYLERVEIYRGDVRVIALLPFHHTFPLQGCIVAPLSVGGMTAIVDQLSAEVIVETLQKYKITMMIGVPRLYKLLHGGIMKKIRANLLARILFSLSRGVNRLGFSRVIFGSVQRRFGGHIEFFISGGARLDPEINQDFRWLGFETLEGYGLTETAPMTTYSPPGKVKVGSVGVAIDDVEVRIVQGEVLIKGPNVMRGYFNKPDATAEAIQDGWFHSGDLGELDEDGYLTITGRSKEIIILDNGKNINPEEIESKIINNYPLVQDVGVYPLDQQLAAIIVPNMETATCEGVVNLEETIRWSVIDAYNQKAAAYKRITEIALSREELPRTRLGKLRRFALPELATGRQGSEIATEQPASKEFGAIKRYLDELKEMSISADQHLEMDIGLDSLDKVELLVFLERTFGVKLDEQILLSHATPRKLSEVMAERKTRMEEETLDWKDILLEDVAVSLPKRVFLLTIFKWIFRPVSRLYFRLEVSGLDNLPVENGYIITPNHQSHLDGAMVAALLRAKTLKETYFFAKEKHFKSWWRRLAATNSNIIVMNLNELKESVQKIGSVLRRGKNMVIFPEGTRSRDGSILPFKKTFAILSKELDVPVIPVAISGAFRSMSTGTIFPRPVKIRVEFLSAIHPGDHDYASLATTTRSAIERSV